MNTDTSKPKIHQGRNIKKIREMLGIKQEVIAIDLDITQQAVSALESKEQIDEDILKKVANILKVPVEAIKNMSDEATYNYINTFNDKVDNSIFNSEVNQPTFNPIDRVVDLYERMLKTEKEKNDLLEKLLDKK